MAIETDRIKFDRIIRDLAKPSITGETNYCNQLLQHKNIIFELNSVFYDDINHIVNNIGLDQRGDRIGNRNFSSHILDKFVNIKTISSKSFVQHMGVILDNLKITNNLHKKSTEENGEIKHNFYL